MKAHKHLRRRAVALTHLSQAGRLSAYGERELQRIRAQLEQGDWLAVHPSPFEMITTDYELLMAMGDYGGVEG